MAQPEPENNGRAAVTALVVLLVLALGAVVVYLLSEINSRRYCVRSLGGTGGGGGCRGHGQGWLTVALAAFEPATAELAAAYAPIPIPTGESLTKTEIYEDRADIDRALFSLFAGWTRARLDSTVPGEFDLAASYVHRSELLPSLSEEQRLELKRMRADLAYKNGRRMLDDIYDRLQRAVAELKLAKELGATKSGDVDRWILEVERRLREYSGAPPVPNLALPAEASPPLPPTPVAPAPSAEKPAAPAAPGVVPQ